jgi:hypothetical protein
MDLAVFTSSLSPEVVATLNAPLSAPVPDSTSMLGGPSASSAPNPARVARPHSEINPPPRSTMPSPRTLVHGQLMLPSLSYKIPSGTAGSSPVGFEGCSPLPSPASAPGPSMLVSSIQFPAQGPGAVPAPPHKEKSPGLKAAIETMNAPHSKRRARKEVDADGQEAAPSKKKRGNDGQPQQVKQIKARAVSSFDNSSHLVLGADWSSRRSRWSPPLHPRLQHLRCSGTPWHLVAASSRHRPRRSRRRNRFCSSSWRGLTVGVRCPSGRPHKMHVSEVKA